jgi:leucyl/phenylalanyl-tRNA--protein transferase
VERQNSRLPSSPPPAATTDRNTDTIRPAPAPAARELSWAKAASQLQQSRERLRELRNRGTVRVQRLMGRATTLLPPSPYGGMCGVFDTLPLTVENVLLGGAQGIYALEVNGTVRWHCPPERFVIYLRELYISPDMRRELKRADYTVTFDRAPREVLAECAAQGTWLSERLQKIYLELFEMGAMHTVEAWQGRVLVGGSIGLTIGTVWSSESLFSRAPHAGKIQFAATASHLLERGFQLVDGQQYSDHFARFGGREIPIAEYRVVLARGLAAPARFYPEGARPALGPSEQAPANPAPGNPAPGNAAPGSTIPGSPASARKHQEKGRNGHGNQGLS